MKTQRGSRDIPLSVNYLGATLGYMVSAKPRPLYPRKSAPVPAVKEAGWAPGPVLTGMEKRNSLLPTWVRNPDRPARSGVAVRTVLYRPPCQNETYVDTKLRYANGSLFRQNIFVCRLIKIKMR